MDYNALKNTLYDIRTLSGLDYFERFFIAWGIPRATIDRVKVDKRADINSGYFISNKAFFMSSSVENLYSVFSVLQRNGLKALSARLVIIENSHALLAYDNSTGESVLIEKAKVADQYDFFLPLIGKERNSGNIGDPITIGVAEQFANLYNDLMLVNKGYHEDQIQNLICFLAYIAYLDSTGELAEEPHHISYLLNEFGKEYGTATILHELHDIVQNHNYAPKSGLNYRVSWTDSYVGFWRFTDIELTCRASMDIYEILNADWSDVQPEIFGALLQESISNDQTPTCYTSNDNIHKVLGPLFLDELYQQYEQGKGNMHRLQQLAHRIKAMQLIDPSCGTGNFLIFAYNELNRLCRLIENESNGAIKCESIIRNLHGIDNSELAIEIAKLSLYIAISQSQDQAMPMSQYADSIDLNSGKALRMEWDRGLPADAEIFIFGNPPYKGAKKMSDEQMADLLFVLGDEKGNKELDYAACWFVKAARIFRYRKGAFSFITTNSLIQGQQVSKLWPMVFAQGCYIQFAYQAFKLKNDAKNNTAVTVVIIGIRPNTSEYPRELFDNDRRIIVSSISPYLTKGNTIVVRRNQPISELPYMEKGNMPYDQGNLLLSPKERTALISEYPTSSKFLRRVIGSDEFINGIERWCLWIHNQDFEEAMSIPPIAERIERCKQFRLQLKDSAGRKLSQRPHQFRETRETHKYSLVIPAVSSERREYIPIGFIDKNVIVTNLSFVIYDCEPWVFSVISSKMHTLWIRTVCGGLETRLRYSSMYGYNTFPFPRLNTIQKESLTKCAYAVLEEREMQSEKTLAEIYNHDQMSVGLRYAHHLLDAAVDRCYRETPFTSDQDRLDFLFEYYTQLTEE